MREHSERDPTHKAIKTAPIAGGKQASIKISKQRTGLDGEELEKELKKKINQFTTTMRIG